MHTKVSHIYLLFSTALIVEEESVWKHTICDRSNFAIAILAQFFLFFSTQQTSQLRNAC